MPELKKRHPKRSDAEWISLIQECRTSGLTDKEWCDRQHIQTSKFYYHIRRLRSKACDLPDNPRVKSRLAHHEVVKLDFSETSQGTQLTEGAFSSELPLSRTDTGTAAMGEPLRSEISATPAIHLSFGNISIDIHNSADRSTILNTLSVLQSLC